MPTLAPYLRERERSCKVNKATDHKMHFIININIYKHIVLDGHPQGQRLHPHLKRRATLHSSSSLILPTTEDSPPAICSEAIPP